MDYSSLYFIILILVTLSLYIFPFLPAWYEWKYKTDAEPFRINFEDRTHVDYTIRLFKEYITENFSDILQNYNQDNTSLYRQTNIPDYYIIGNSEPLELENKEVLAQSTSKLILISGKGILPEHIHFKNKVYSTDTLDTGTNNRFNEIYSEKDILIGANTEVQKLAYANGSIIIEDNVTLNCYTKAASNIQFLGDYARFQYLHASAITFGQVENRIHNEAVDVFGANLPRIIEEKEYILAENSEVMSHFVVKSPLLIANNCKIVGNIKCHQDIEIGENTLIFGSIFSEKNISIADNCYIQGPIITNQSIKIGKNCLIGPSNSKTSIVAEYISISKGCYISGQILAKIQGIYSN